MRFQTFCLLTLTFSISSSLAFADEAGDKIVRLADEARGPQTSFSTTIQVKDTRKGEVKQSEFRVYAKGVRFSLVDQMSPERQRGRKLLMRDHDLWVYMPTVSRPTRISFEQKLTGEVANGDLMRTNFASDYAATVTGQEKINGSPAYKLHLVAKNKEATYRTIDYWVDIAKHYPVKAVFYALSGKPLKTAMYSDFKPVLGRPRMTKVIITDFLQTGSTSELTYSAYKKENLDDAYFNKEALVQ